MLSNQIEQSGPGIQLFTNPAFGSIRTAGTNEAPLFCLADICKAVELTNPSSVRARLEDEDVQLIDLHALNSIEGTTSTGNGVANFVSESGFYDVLLQSSSPKVRPFRKWVTSEVLPSIRKSGGYIQASEDDSEADIMARALMIAQKTIDEKKQRIQMLEGEKALLQQENEVMSPKAQYTDDVLQSTSTITLTALAKELEFVSVQSMLKFFSAHGIMYRQGETWLPYAKYSGKGYFATRTHRFFHNDGSIGTSTTTVVTEKGRLFFHNYFNNFKK